MNLGQNLKTVREQYKISQNQLAKRTQIKQQNISRWENNQNLPNIIDCVKLADFYGITIDELIGRDFIKN